MLVDALRNAESKEMLEAEQAGNRYEIKFDYAL